MPGMHSHLYLRQEYIPSPLYGSAQPSIRTDNAFYRNSNPHPIAASAATLAVHRNSTTTRSILPSRRTKHGITLCQLHWRIFNKQVSTIQRNSERADQAQPTGHVTRTRRKPQHRIHHDRRKVQHKARIITNFPQSKKQ